MIVRVLYFVINGIALQIILDVDQILLLLFENANQEMYFKGKRVIPINKVSEIVIENTNSLIVDII